MSIKINQNKETFDSDPHSWIIKCIDFNEQVEKKSEIISCEWGNKVPNV